MSTGTSPDAGTRGEGSDGATIVEAIDRSATALGLRTRDDIVEPGWRFWELRTLNRHRVVGIGHFEVDGVPASPMALRDAIRGLLANHFHRSWWRGLAFGIVVELQPLAWSAADVAPIVDLREDRHGVLQWIVLADPEASRAVAVHTWEALFLSPVYVAVEASLRGSGFAVESAIRQMDGLTRLLTGVSAADGVFFPSFRDPPSTP